MINLLADIPLSPGGGFKGKGPLGLEGRDASQAPDVFNKFFSMFIGVITIVSFISFIILFISGAVALMTAGGDKQKLETARSRITTAIIGLVIVISAMFIIDLVGSLFGIDDILNPGSFIEKLGF